MAGYLGDMLCLRCFGKMRKIILFGLIFLIIPVVFAGVDVTPDEPTTLDDLNCIVDTTVTNYEIEWYLDDDPAGINIDFVNHTFTSKNQIWECRAGKYYPYAGYVPIGSNSVVIKNTPPILGDISDITVNETDNVTIIANATDVDLPSEILTYSINDTARFTQPSADTFLWTTTYDDEGVYEFIVTVTDSNGANDSKSFTVTVLKTNRPPIVIDVNVTIEGITGVPPANAYENDTLECIGNYTDPDGDAESGSAFKWFNNLAEITGAVGSTLTGDYFSKGDVISCEYTPYDGEDFGNATNSTNSITILNTLPYFNPALENQTVAENANLLYTIHCDDIDNDTIAYSDNSTQWTIDSATGLINWTPSFTDEGYYTYTITCDDGDGSVNGVFSINVTHTNSPPTAAITAPANDSSYYEGDLISFTGTGDDLEEGALAGDSLVWTSDINGNFGNGTAVDYNGLSVGYHTITLTATDSEGGAGTDVIYINVTNTAPVAAITAPLNGSSFEAGDLISFTGTGDDLEEGALAGDSLVWESDVDGNFGNGTAVDYSGLSVGSHIITLTATDSFGLFGTDSINLEITVYIPDTGNIVINEFMANPSSGDDWIELYNNNSELIEIGDWTLEDTTSVMHTIPAGTTLDVGMFYIINVSNRLDNAGDTISLYNSSADLIDSYTYAADPGLDVSVGRYPNGIDSWYSLTVGRLTPMPTPGAANIYGSVVEDSWIDNVEYPGSGYYHDITGVADSVINISNITATVDVDYSEIFNSTIINSPVDNCTILNSRLENGFCQDAYIDPSDIKNSNTSGSTILNSHVWDSDVINSTVTDSTIDYSDIYNSVIANSIMNNMTLTDGNLTDNVIYSGVISWYNGTGIETYDADVNGSATLTDIINYPPFASFTVSSSSITEGGSVTFTSTSTDVNIGGALNDSLTYFWDFGDGANETNSTATSHTYSSAGSFTASLTVTDSFGLSDSESATITVNSPSTPPPSGGGGSSGGGGGGGSSFISRFIDLKDGPVTITLKKSEMAKFLFREEYHYVRARSIELDSTEILVASTFKMFKTDVGTGFDVDLDDDNEDDLTIELMKTEVYDSSSKSTATLKIGLIEEEPEEAEEEAEEEEEIEEETEEELEEEVTEEEWEEYTPKAPSGWFFNVVKEKVINIPYIRYVVTGIVILAIVLIVLKYGIEPQKKKKKSKRKNRKR